MSNRIISAVAIFSLLLGLATLNLQPAIVGAQETITVPVGDIWFCSADYENGVCTTQITQGDTVSWDFSGAVNAHTTTACGASCDSPAASPLWDSGITQGGGVYQFTFTEPGTYAYYCQVHPYQRGQIVVTAAQQDEPTATPDANATPVPGATPSAVTPPTVGTGSQSGATNTWWLAAMAGVGLALVGSGLLFARTPVRAR